MSRVVYTRKVASSVERLLGSKPRFLTEDEIAKMSPMAQKQLLEALEFAASRKPRSRRAPMHPRDLAREAARSGVTLKA